MLKKQRVSEYVPNIVKYMLIKILFTSLIEKWLINHKEIKV